MGGISGSTRFAPQAAPRLAPPGDDPGRVRMVIMGCGTMPHVGRHPGTGALLAFVALGGIAGLHEGVFAALAGAAFMAVTLGPIYLFGAYGRAKLSLRLACDSGRHRDGEKPQALSGKAMPERRPEEAASPESQLLNSHLHNRKQ